MLAAICCHNHKHTQIQARRPRHQRQRGRRPPQPPPQRRPRPVPSTRTTTTFLTKNTKNTTTYRHHRSSSSDGDSDGDVSNSIKHHKHNPDKLEQLNNRTAICGGRMAQRPDVTKHSNNVTLQLKVLIHTWMVRRKLRVDTQWQICTVVQALAAIPLVDSIGFCARRIVWTARLVHLIVAIRCLPTHVVAVIQIGTIEEFLMQSCCCNGCSHSTSVYLPFWINRSKHHTQ